MKQIHYMIGIVLSTLLFMVSCDAIMGDLTKYSDLSMAGVKFTDAQSLIGTHVINKKSIEVIEDDLVIEGQSVKDALLSHDPAGEWKASNTKDMVVFIFTPSKDIPADSTGFPQKDLVAGTEYPIVITRDTFGTSIAIKDTEILDDILINTGGTVSGTGTGGSKIVYVATPQTSGELQALIVERIKRDGDQANLNDIDVSNITHMGSLFYGSSFNGDISQWDVSNVTNMSYMFSHALQFNGDISQWDVSNVTNMSHMFKTTSSFNQDISGWDVGNVIDMYSMFRETAFNQDISGWNVSNVTNVGYMFYSSRYMTHNLEAWGSKLPVGVQKHNTWKYSILEGSGNVPSWA